MSDVLRKKIIRLAASFPAESVERDVLLAAIVEGADKEAWGRAMPVMPREFHLPPHARETPPITPSGTDLAIYKYEDKGVLYGIAFQAKSNKPVWHYRFRNEQDFEREVESTAQARRMTLQHKVDKMLDRRMRQHDLKVGDILVSSWGYDQTNIDFYEVTSIIGKQVTIREIATRFTEQNGPAGNKVVPIPGRYVGPEMRKLPSGSGANVSVKINGHQYARKWDGSAQYAADTQFGH